jgi:predicted esterase
LGIWLVAGPLFGSETNLRFATQGDFETNGERIVEVKHAASVVPGRAFSLLQASQGRYDLGKTLRTQPNSYALFAGVLRAAKPTKVVLILDADDGVRVTLDGRVVLNKDLVRPPLHADDAVELDLSAGDHPLLIRLRQRSGDWRFGARLLDASDLAPPRDVQLVLPGADVAKVNVADLVKVELEMSSFADRYEPLLRVSAEGGLPAGLSLPISVTASVQREGSEVRLFRAALGDLPAGTRRVHDLEARLPAVAASALEQGDEEAPVEYRVKVGGHETKFLQRGHPFVRRALGVLDQAVIQLEESGDEGVIRSTLELSRSRLDSFLSTRDDDLPATVEEARVAERFGRDLIEGRDPLRQIRGPMRLAYPSPLDGKNRPFGVYVPPSFAGDGKRFPLVVVLHGLNGLPMQMIRIFFGQDHPWRRAPWEDRHVRDLPALDAFVVSPSGYGNMSYREFGEVDVMHLVDWMKRVYPIDADRVYVTGLSMGGTGAGAIGLRHADQFAAIAPLCGYHSYALRRDMAYRPLRPWETALSSFWSNVSWAENGKNLPLFVVHGKQDLPVANSGVLIDRYKDLGYFVYSEHPDVGHNVWQQTYEGFKGYGWLARHKRDPEPKEVVLKTASLRYADHAWVHVEELDEHLTWGQVKARVRDRSSIEMESSGVRALRLDRPAKHVDPSLPLVVIADGTELTFAPGATVSLHRRDGRWVRGAALAPDWFRKKKGLSGPIRDAFLEPLVFVVGTRESSLTQANLHVARALASPPYGVEARWPVVADVDVTDAIASSHALFLIGSSRSNAYVARIEDRLPIRVEGRRVVTGEAIHEGQEIGALFVHPNPLHPDRYVVVLSAPDVAGTLRALSLPRMLPDFVVYDAKVAGARGQMVLGSASLVAGGMFDERWRLPSP